MVGGESLAQILSGTIDLRGVRTRRPLAQHDTSYLNLVELFQPFLSPQGTNESIPARAGGEPSPRHRHSETSEFPRLRLRPQRDKNLRSPEGLLPAPIS